MTWVKDTDEKLRMEASPGKPKPIKFQQFKVMSWTLFAVKDDGLDNQGFPAGRYQLDQDRLRTFKGELKICEMPGQPIHSIRATVGSELCLLHGPDCSILLKDFYVTNIETRVSGSGRDEYGDPFNWSAQGHLEPDEGKMLDDLRNTIWVMDFHYTGVEIAKRTIQESQFNVLPGAGWGEDNKDGTKIIPKDVSDSPLWNKLVDIHNDVVKTERKFKNNERDTKS